MRAFISPYTFTFGLQGYINRLILRDLLYQDISLNIVKLNGVEETPFFTKNSMNVSFMELFREPNSYNSTANTAQKLKQIHRAYLYDEKKFQISYKNLLLNEYVNIVTFPSTEFKPLSLSQIEESSFYGPLFQLLENRDYDDILLTEDSTIKDNFKAMGLEDFEYVFLTFQNLDQLKSFANQIPLKTIVLYIPWLIEYRSQLPNEAFVNLINEMTDKIDSLVSDAKVITIQEPISESFFSYLVSMASYVNG